MCVFQQTLNMDNTYILKVVAGDAQAFAFLVDKYKDMCFAAAFRIVKNREVAEDIVQDAFLSAYKNLKNFKGESKFSTWLYKIVVNESLTKVRRTKFMREKAHDIVGGFNEHDLNESLALLKQKEQVLYIENTLQQMIDREALVMQLYYLDELSLKEIAEVLKLKPDHIKVILHRARKNFYALLNEQLKHELSSIL